MRTRIDTTLRQWCRTCQEATVSRICSTCMGSPLVCSVCHREILPKNDEILPDLPASANDLSAEICG